MSPSPKSNPDPSGHWLDEAKKLADAHWRKTPGADGTAIYLVDPQVRQEVHQYLKHTLWPSARKTLIDRGFDLLHANEPIIDDEWQYNICASAKLIITDPDHARPIGEPGRPWFCRMAVEYRSDQSRLIHDELILYLSLRTDLELVTGLVRNTTHPEGLPTRLSFEEGDSGDDIWIVTFEHGAGGLGGPYSDHLFPEFLRQHLLKYCDFIDLAENLVGAPNNALVFERLAAQVNNLFRAPKE